jgi:hypothetical protein
MIISAPACARYTASMNATKKRAIKSGVPQRAMLHRGGNWNLALTVVLRSSTALSALFGRGEEKCLFSEVENPAHRYLNPAHPCITCQPPLAQTRILNAKDEATLTPPQQVVVNKLIGSDGTVNVRVIRETAAPDGGSPDNRYDRLFCRSPMATTSPLRARERFSIRSGDLHGAFVSHT